MEDLSERSAQEVLDEHLSLTENWGAEEDWRRVVEEDLRRNVSEECVILAGGGRGVFHDHEGVMELAEMLGEELPEHRSFEYIYRAVEGRMTFWSGLTKTLM